MTHDERIIHIIAAQHGCHAELVRNGSQMPDIDPLAKAFERIAAEPAPYPLQDARRAWLVEQIRNGQAESDGMWLDPRNEAERAQDEFDNEVIETRKSDYPI